MAQENRLKQNSDHAQNGGASGTSVTSITPRPYGKGTTKLGSSSGVSGENADQGNRNKRS